MKWDNYNCFELENTFTKLIKIHGGILHTNVGMFYASIMKNPVFKVQSNHS